MSEPRQYSPDGKWWWDGQKWRPAAEYQPAAEHPSSTNPNRATLAVPVWIAIPAVLITGVIGWFAWLLFPLMIVSLILLWISTARWRRSNRLAAIILAVVWVGFWGAVSISLVISPIR